MEHVQTDRPILCPWCKKDLIVSHTFMPFETVAGAFMSILSYCEACHKPIPVTVIPIPQRRPDQRSRLIV